jgi:hypothetical protein
VLSFHSPPPEGNIFWYRVCARASSEANLLPFSENDTGFHRRPFRSSVCYNPMWDVGNYAQRAWVGILIKTVSGQWEWQLGSSCIAATSQVRRFPCIGKWSRWNWVRFRTLLFRSLRRVCGFRLDFPKELQATPPHLLPLVHFIAPFVHSFFSFTVFHWASDMYTYYDLQFRRKHLHRS